MAGLEVQIASDLHIEFMATAEEAFAATFGAPPVVTSPVLALLGDIGLVREEALFTFLLLCTKHWRHVLFLKGNHELYQTRMLRNAITIEEGAWVARLCVAPLVPACHAPSCGCACP